MGSAVLAPRESAAEVQVQLYEAFKAAEDIFTRRLGTRDVVDVATPSVHNSETEIN